MNEINLYDLELKTFTEQDALDYCLLNSINPDYITKLNLGCNELTSILGIKLFKNIIELYIESNKIIDISDLKNLNKLEILQLQDNELTDISVLKNLINLKKLYLKNNQIKDISVIQNFKNLIFLDISYLELESDQIKYFKFVKKLKELRCHKGFKDMDVLDKLSKNIKFY